MITISQIKDGRSYVSRHLRANDYYSEGESVIGYWRGKAAQILGLEGKTVTNEVCEALRNNRNPATGEKLRPRISKVVFHDVVVSAPKAVSVAALVGGDERLRQAHEQAAERTRKRLEEYVEARDRSGANYNRETTVRTSNGVSAVFQHDTSRLLDPQLHTHNLFSNHTWFASKQDWRALQPKEMMDQVPQWIRRAYYRDLAKACEGLGYQVEWRSVGFGLKGISRETEELLSTRTMQRRRFFHRYRTVFGESPTKKRVEHFIKDRKGGAEDRFKDEYQIRFGKEPSQTLVDSFVRDWRSNKMNHSSREEVATRSQKILSDAGRFNEVQETVKQARGLNFQEAESMSSAQHHVAQKPSLIQKSSAKSQRQRKQKVNRQAIGRMEAIRRMRKGMLIARAIQGHPALLLAVQFTQSSRERNHHATRRN